MYRLQWSWDLKMCPYLRSVRGWCIEMPCSLQVATAIVYGSSDTRLGQESLDNLRALPNSVVVRLPEAGHAAYMDKPDLWHTILYNFLQAL